MRVRKELRKSNLAHPQKNLCQASDMPKRATRTFAQAIGQLLRDRFDENKSELARTVGVNPSTVGRWLDGQNPGAETIEQICSKLRISASELLGEETPPPPSVSRDSIASREQATAVDYLIGQGYDTDNVAMAASIVARSIKDGSNPAPLWWVAQITELLHKLT